MSTSDYRPVEETEGRPVEAPERPQEARTRSVRRPARGPGRTARKPPPKSRTAKAPTTNPEEAIRGLLQIPATAVVMVGQRAGSVALVADGATVLVHGPAFASALAEVAENDPRVMAILEKLVSFGPYAALTTAVVIMGAQFARNHEAGPAPILEGFGAVPPHQIIEAASLDVPVEAPSPNGQANVPPPAN